MIAFLGCVKPRRDNKKWLKCTENVIFKAFNCNPPLKKQGGISATMTRIIKTALVPKCSMFCDCQKRNKCVMKYQISIR